MPKEDDESANKRVCAQAKTCCKEQVRESVNGLMSALFLRKSILDTKIGKIDGSAIQDEHPRRARMGCQDAKDDCLGHRQTCPCSDETLETRNNRRALYFASKISSAKLN